jgi:hypothetical protein
MMQQSLKSFDLFTLSRKQFNLLYLCLHKDKLQNAPLTIKQASNVEGRNHQHGKDYPFSLELYRDLVKRTPNGQVKIIKCRLSAVENSSSRRPEPVEGAVENSFDKTNESARELPRQRPTTPR